MTAAPIYTLSEVFLTLGGAPELEDAFVSHVLTAQVEGLLQLNRDVGEAHAVSTAIHRVVGRFRDLAGPRWTLSSKIKGPGGSPEG